MDLSDPRWRHLKGGYRLEYDPRSALTQLEAGIGTIAAWDELWNELHHQGDVGEASYAAVTQIAQLVASGKVSDWNAFSLPTVIEQCRRASQNPELPIWLIDEYHKAWESLFASALSAVRTSDDEYMLSSAIALLALHKALPHLAAMALMSERERQDLLVEVGLAA